jgi:hypothetical protein
VIEIKARLTIGDHVRGRDDPVEEGEDLDHLALLLTMSELAGAEGFRYVDLKELVV